MAGVHHHLGFDLPERAGFGGLWSALEAPPAPVSLEVRHPVASSSGASSPAVRAAVAAFVAAIADTDPARTAAA